MSRESRRLGDHDIELALSCVFEKPLISRPQRGRAADRAVRIGVEIGPAFELDPLPADPHLILDRGLALQV